MVMVRSFKYTFCAGSRPEIRLRDALLTVTLQGAGLTFRPSAVDPFNAGKPAIMPTAKWLNLCFALTGSPLPNDMQNDRQSCR